MDIYYPFHHEGIPPESKVWVEADGWPNGQGLGESKLPSGDGNQRVVVGPTVSVAKTSRDSDHIEHP